MSVEIVLHGALEDTAQPLALTHVAHVPARDNMNFIMRKCAKICWEKPANFVAKNPQDLIFFSVYSSQFSCPSFIYILRIAAA
jgi:hypothetical protein